jgi:hypothetical protein
MKRLLQISLSSGALLLLATPVFAVDIVTCGQIVPPSETGVLVADLDCSASAEPFSVTLRSEAILDLNGHTLTGPPAGEDSSSAAAVRCDPAEETCVSSRCVNYCVDSNKPCTVTSSTGMGTIVGSTGIVADRSLVAGNLHVTAANTGIILGYRGRLRATNLLLDGDASVSIRAVPLSLCADVYKGGKLALENVTVSGGGVMVAYQGKITARDLLIQDNATGGISTERLTLTRATVRDNGGIGVLADRMRLSDSEVTGNLYLGSPMDVATGGGGQMPSLRDTTCDRSGKFNYNFDYAGTWGICAGD